MGSHKGREKLCPGWELNLQPSHLISVAPPTELHGQIVEQAVGIKDINSRQMIIEGSLSKNSVPMKPNPVIGRS